MIASDRPALRAQNMHVYKALLPIVSFEIPNRSLFGFDINPQASATALALAHAAQPHLSRMDGILWSDLEPQRGAPYHWERLVQVEQHIRTLHTMGIEPILGVQGAPAWARLYPDYPCSPIAPAFFDDFAHVMQALAARYRTGPLSVRFWEIWNEPDFFRDNVQSDGGFGCWAEPGQPFSGGDRFGALLNAVYAPIKAGNPGAQVIAGSLSHIFPGAQYSDFLEGMLASGAGASFDLLGFHAYSDWRYDDLLVRKVTYARTLLTRYGYGDRPLLLTEIAALCLNDSRCSPDPPADIRLRQANQAARLNAEIAGLHLAGALWYTLVATPPGFAQGQLISAIDGNEYVLPSYYAVRNSALLLLDAQPTETVPHELSTAEWNDVQELRFLKSDTTLHVLWVQQTDHPVAYTLRVPPGAHAACWERLDQDVPVVSDCSDGDGDGKIVRAVNESPQYIEVAR